MLCCAVVCCAVQTLLQDPARGGALDPNFYQSMGQHEHEQQQQQQQSSPFPFESGLSSFDSSSAMAFSHTQAL